MTHAAVTSCASKLFLRSMFSALDALSANTAVIGLSTCASVSAPVATRVFVSVSVSNDANLNSDWNPVTHFCIRSSDFLVSAKSRFATGPIVARAPSARRIARGTAWWTPSPIFAMPICETGRSDTNVNTYRRRTGGSLHFEVSLANPDASESVLSHARTRVA